MITRVVQRKRPRRSALAVVGVIALLATGLFGATALATIPPPPADTGCTGGPFPNSVEVTSNDDSADCTTGDGALVSYIGSNDTDRQSSGTGLFDPFVRLQAAPDEEGFNTNAAVTLDAKAGQWTKAILVSAIPIVNIGGTNYWELFVDINDKNNSKPISLNKVEIYFAPPPDGDDITGYEDPGFAGFSETLVYAFDGVIKINDVNSGSGRGDLRYLVPLTNIPTPPAGTWFVLYSEWGTTAGYTSDGGFEEWKVRKAPNLSIVKTADAASVSAGTNIGFTITVTNSGVADATGVTISDPLPGGPGISWSESPAHSDCSISIIATVQTLNCGPVTLAPGDSLSVHVQSATTAASCGTYNNTATFTSTDAGSGTATDSVIVQCGALLILKQSTKTAGDPPVNTPVLNAGAEFCYSTTVDCTVTNVTDNGTGDVDSTTIGTVCVSGLVPGTYYINETAAPDGYGGASQSNVAVTVANGTSCIAGSLPAAAATATFINPPLADIQVIVTDAGSGETNSSIVCAQSGTTIPADDENGDDDPAFDDTDETFSDLAPGTYTCTVVVDP